MRVGYIRYRDEINMARMYLFGESLQDIALHYKIRIEDVIKYLKRNCVYKDCEYKLDLDTLYVITEMYLSGLTLHKISELTEVPYNILKEKFKCDSINELSCDDRDINTKLIDDYLLGFSVKQLALKYEMTVPAILDRLRKFEEYKNISTLRINKWKLRNNKIKEKYTKEILQRL